MEDTLEEARATDLRKRTMNANSKITAIDSEIGALIRKHRVAKGWTLIALAVALGCTHQQLAKYERGQDRVSAARLLQIAQALKVPVTVVLSRPMTDPKPLQSAAQPLRRGGALLPSQCGPFHNRVPVCTNSGPPRRDPYLRGGSPFMTSRRMRYYGRLEPAWSCSSALVVVVSLIFIATLVMTF